jgi:hypothetical protein
MGYLFFGGVNSKNWLHVQVVSLHMTHFIVKFTKAMKIMIDLVQAGKMRERKEEK